MAEQETLLARLHDWLGEACTASSESGATEGLLNALGETELSNLGADLEGLHEGASAVASAITLLLDSGPSEDALEDRLVGIEVDLSHALWHWKSIVKLLRSKGLWMEDAIDLGRS